MVEAAIGIWVIDNVLPNPSKFINDIEGAARSNLVTWNKAQVGRDHVLDTTVRDVESIGVPPIASGNYENMKSSKREQYLYRLSKELDDAILPHIDLYSQAHKMRVKTWEGRSILRYGAGQFFKNHSDADADFPRTLSYSFYLNDDYEGGEIEFDRFRLRIKPDANQLVIFPSNFIYSHEVLPVISGTRYAVVQWGL